MATWPRLEVASMWLKLNSNNNNNNECNYGVNNRDNNIYSGHFKGRILLADTVFINEIYNSKTLDSLYADMPSRNKRKMRDFTAEHTDLLSTDVEEVEDESVVSEKTDYLPMNEKAGHARLISLPVMGPERGMLILPEFHVVVHEDSGDPKIEEDLLNQAKETVFGGSYTLWDDAFETCHAANWGYDKKFSFVVAFKSVVVKLDCVVYTYCKVVHLEIEWLKPNNDTTTDIDATDGATDNYSTDDATDDAADYGYLRGSITLTNDIYDDIVSVLLDTPPKKAVKVKPGKPIPLLKSVVVVPFRSDFTVNAELQYDDNTSSAFYPIVEQGEAIFPVEDDDEDFEPSEYTYPNKTYQRFPFYKSTKYIDCIDGGRLKVKALVMRDH